MENNLIEWWHVGIGMLLRYCLIAGLAYLIFYVWKLQIFRKLKIQQAFPKFKAVRLELFYSLLTIVIFTLVIYLTFFSSFREYTQLYTDTQKYSMWYLWLSLPLIIILHDTYFYWMHRLMHWKVIFPYVHKVHHQSHNPTPLAAFSFHPLEALIEVSFLPMVILLVPFYPLVIFIFGFYMILMNVLGHLGFELFPKWFLKNKVTALLNTSTHHNMHHHYGKGNYSLYFNIWDRLLNTNHPHYEKEFLLASEGNKTKALSDKMLLTDKNRLLTESN